MAGGRCGGKKRCCILSIWDILSVGHQILLLHFIISVLQSSLKIASCPDLFRAFKFFRRKKSWRIEFFSFSFSLIFFFLCLDFVLFSFLLEIIRSNLRKCFSKGIFSTRTKEKKKKEMTMKSKNPAMNEKKSNAGERLSKNEA